MSLPSNATWCGCFFGEHWTGVGSCERCPAGSFFQRNVDSSATHGCQRCPADKPQTTADGLACQAPDCEHRTFWSPLRQTCVQCDFSSFFDQKTGLCYPCADGRQSDGVQCLECLKGDEYAVAGLVFFKKYLNCDCFLILKLFQHHM